MVRSYDYDERQEDEEVVPRPRPLSSMTADELDERARLLEIEASEATTADERARLRAASDLIRAHRRRSVLGRLHAVREHPRSR